MECPSCRHENPGDSRFCLGCGARLGPECPSCGRVLPAGSKFCNACGHALKELRDLPSIDFQRPRSYTPKHLADKIVTTRSALEGERKVVTVLFADVVESTAIFEKLDPEDVHRIMDGCFRVVLDQVHRYGGTVNQFRGDCVMALFGAPLAHEDHAQRACHAALAMRAALEEYGRGVAVRWGIPFRMRIGLNSGLVVVGRSGTI
jgi:class 3 adenylate cyclase